MTDLEGASHLPASPDLALSLIIPAYNESARLAAGLVRLNSAVASGSLDPTRTEIIVVDDGSTDGTAACAREMFGGYPHLLVISLPANRGKGAAVRAGVTAASAPTIAFADADMAIDPIQIPQFIASLDHASLAIGSRAASGASVDRPSIRRSIMNRTFNHFVNAVTHLSLDDTQCGFKMFRAPAARLLFHGSTTERMAFDVEILWLARRLGMPIAQVPVHWSRVDGSRVRSWSDSGSMVRDVLRAQRRTDAAPPLPALHIGVGEAIPDDTRQLFHRLALTQPLVRIAPTEVLVLCPLMDAASVDQQRHVLAGSPGIDWVVPERLTPRQLRDLAPLRLEWEDPVIVALSS